MKELIKELTGLTYEMFWYLGDVQKKEIKNTIHELVIIEKITKRLDKMTQLLKNYTDENKDKLAEKTKELHDNFMKYILMNADAIMEESLKSMTND